MTGASTAGSLARKPTRTATHPYPSFCFSSLLMGAALAVPTDVANTRQRAAVAATRFHGARWGTRHPQPRPPPASLMAPRFRARAAATPARWATLRAAGGEEAASRGEGGLWGYFRVEQPWDRLRTNGNCLGEGLPTATGRDIGQQKRDVDKRRDWAGSCPFDPPPTPGVATWELLVPKCTASFAWPTAPCAGALLNFCLVARCVLGLVVLSCKGHAGSRRSEFRWPFGQSS
ncbi:hypothetical protein I79_007147 [Cricetulus griseus]|uniref:Uncharacterized protein n=1 Tax=Cricetulus griseus TaxID=10029 RepID=G3H9R7_CRIGR|nr:hypothetical protein I79_007147 [Cricetulus griseus]